MVLSTLTLHAGLFHQVKRRLEVEAGFSWGLNDDGGGTEGQKPCTDGKSKILVYIIQQAGYIKGGRCMAVFLYFTLLFKC